MERYKIADEKIMYGYDYLADGKIQKACDIWLESWEYIKSIMADAGIGNINELQKKYKWSEYLFNYVQDLETELYNAALEDKEYFHKRIKYCEEMLAVCGEEDKLIVENTRRAIAESHFELGNEKECDRLFGMWLESDPNWGWGYIGWSDCYHFRKDRADTHLEKAEAIIAKALEQKDLQDRLDVTERAIEIYEAMGNDGKVSELRKEIAGMKGSTTTGPIKVEKVGRNSPCPCGSGKKYKKCCGKR